MDLNYLYYRQGIERMRADAAACPPSQAAHRDLAARYGILIERIRTDPAPGLPKA